VVLLIRWYSASGWKIFQESPRIYVLDGADLIVGYPLHKTLCLQTADWDLHADGHITEITLVKLRSAASDIAAAGVEEDAKPRHALMAKIGGFRPSVQVVERHAGLDPPSDPVEERASANIVADIVVWDDVEEYSASTDDQGVADAEKAVMSQVTSGARLIGKLGLFDHAPVNRDPQIL
jgi:hypothetical protein